MHFSASTFMASYLHHFSEVVLFGTNLYYIWYKFSIMTKNNNVKTEPSTGAIWDEFNEQHQYQSIKKHYI